MNRRSLLAALPATVAACAAPAAALCIVDPAETPIAAMLREILRLRAFACDQAVPDAEADIACTQLTRLANEIADIPAHTAEDMLRKIMGYTVNGDHELGDSPRGQEIWAEARALVA